MLMCFRKGKDTSGAGGGEKGVRGRSCGPCGPLWGH